MTGVAQDRPGDHSLAFYREGYRFVGNRCRRLGSDAFETRLIGCKTVCVLGAEGARMFYDLNRMGRRGALPAPVRTPLLGKGGVQGLDGAAHRQRKRLFMSLMTPERRAALADQVAEQWRRAADSWSEGETVVLLPAAQQVLCRAICTWSGVPLPEAEAPARCGDLAMRVAGAARVGPAHLRARLARHRTERWIGSLVERVRGGELAVPDEAALAQWAGYRDADGAQLPARVAAVEVLNVLRPTVAVAIWVTFLALALHRYPRARALALDGGQREREWLVQEVRRFYSFFPVVAAKVAEPFEWRGYRFEPGRRVILDLYGTDHDERIWDAPEEFRPERFADWQPDPFELIPQGGADHEGNHRCAGEWITLDLMQRSLAFLAATAYRVPDQDLSVSLATVPMRPRSGFVIEPAA